ncbi:MAG: DUF308 domain-containing protein [Gammaproteobacteria bacterium]|nr:MAG: DUF308 domain-containing protein [Gammaproteobacteria bacterium]
MLNPLDQLDEPTLKKLQSHALGIGILLMILGVAGVILPGIMSLASALFVGWLMLFGGAVTAYHTYQTHPKGLGGWFKALVLLASGTLMILFPVPGVAALGILLAAYLFLDALSSFAMALEGLVVDVLEREPVLGPGGDLSHRLAGLLPVAGGDLCGRQPVLRWAHPDPAALKPLQGLRRRHRGQGVMRPREGGATFVH